MIYQCMFRMRMFEEEFEDVTAQLAAGTLKAGLLAIMLACGIEAYTGPLEEVAVVHEHGIKLARFHPRALECSIDQRVQFGIR